MKIAILADIHSNLKALEAVLEDVEKQGGASGYWCLGDIVDYGPLPHECLETIRRLNSLGVSGNHDLAVAGSVSTANFAQGIDVVTNWTRTRLSREELDYLKNLPLTVTTGRFTLAHGSPRDPVWEYLTNEEAARRSLDFFTTPCCLVGHTHVPIYFQFALKDPSGAAEEILSHPHARARWAQLVPHDRRLECLIRLNDDAFLINPGSVGQPRDNDPRAAYALYDEDDCTLELRRVEYDIQATRRTMQQFGLPAWFNERLQDGI